MAQKVGHHDQRPSDSTDQNILPPVNEVQYHKTAEQPATPQTFSSPNAHSTLPRAAKSAQSRPFFVQLDASSQTKGRSRSSSLPFPGTFGNEDLTKIPSARRQTVLTPLDSIDPARQPEVQKMSPSQIYDLTMAPDSLPMRAMTPTDGLPDALIESNGNALRLLPDGAILPKPNAEEQENISRNSTARVTPRRLEDTREMGGRQEDHRHSTPRPNAMLRSASAQGSTGKNRNTPGHLKDWGSGFGRGDATAQKQSTAKPQPLPELTPAASYGSHMLEKSSSPVEPSLPIPPFSLPTYLQLELSSQRPSPLYIHRSSGSDIPYESSHVKFQRLLNFLLLPPQLEQTLLFGALTCLDAFLYTFTVAPLRFGKSVWILLIWLSRNAFREIQDLWTFVYSGVGRVWRRRQRRDSIISTPSSPTREEKPLQRSFEELFDRHSRPVRSRRPFPKHRRTRSTPSTLQQNHKADLLQGLLIITSCVVLTRFDASRMYHNIRGQAAIKLYVIYNMLEVFDRLLSALGQDILDCLFSPETLDRNEHGRSKVLKPFWMFLLALAYCVVHSMGLFYQVITLNVAVNSYSNALLTLLLSNQFVEIKGSVFKKIEKENLFQLTCADVVERFQLWVMLLIIALRNIVEVGGLSIHTSGTFFSGPSSESSPNPNATATAASSGFGILPNAFTLLPNLAAVQVLSPFLLVLASEMLVDWLKHAYITKFNATTPKIYSRFLDVLAKDYYSHAFGDQNLTRRLGLPVIPLACLFIRATLQTYHMFLATNISAPVLSSATSLDVDASTQAPPASSPLFAQLDTMFRRALGHSSFGGGSGAGIAHHWTVDDAIALATMLVFFAALYLLLLAFKLALGMALLSYARRRYAGMNAREKERVRVEGTRRLGGWGVTEVGEERRKWIYEDDPKALQRLRDKEARDRDKERDGKVDDLKSLEKVDRYAMVAKRIW